MYGAHTNAEGNKPDLAVKRSNIIAYIWMTIILANLVNLSSPMICAKIQLQDIFSSGEEDF